MNQTNYLFVNFYRSCALFGIVGVGLHEVSLSPSVSNNATALHAIFTKMLGITDNQEITSIKKLINIVSDSNNPDSAVEINTSEFLSNKSTKTLCQGVKVINAL